MLTIRKGRHCAFELHAHLVFSTKYRGKVFNDKHLKTLENIFRHVCNEFEVELIEFNGETDHIHLLIHYPPKVQLSKLVNSLKGVSSRKMKLHHPELVKPAYLKNALWARSYFAGSCGGASIDVLKTYIENQARPD
nr:IS200/IS605 family transposase [Endozoicomonas montiporae]